MKCHKSENPTLCFFKMVFDSVRLRSCCETDEIESPEAFCNGHEKAYFHNLSVFVVRMFFGEYTACEIPLEEELIKIIRKIIRNIPPKYAFELMSLTVDEPNEYEYVYDIYKLDNCGCLYDEERKILYDYLIRKYRINEVLNKIDEYTKKYTASPQKEEESFFDTF